MDIETVVREVTVRGTSQGMDQVAADYRSVGTQADGASASISKSASSAAAAEAAINKLGVQLQANYAQQAQFNEMIAQQSSALQQVSAANDNAAGSYKSSGLELAVVANHLRQGAEAAYAFSPAFRGVVNEMAAPVLSAAGTAVAAVATGLVTATNYAGTGLIALAGAAEKVAPGFLGLTSGIRSAGIAMEAFNPAVAGVATSILGVAGTIVSRFLPLVGQMLLVYDAIKLVGQAWELGAKKLQEYVDLSAKAAALNVSTDFLQRITKAAEDAKVPIDTLTAALTKMQEALAPKLGGSDAVQQIDKLAGYGNFQGNTGVGTIKQATSPEQQFAAVIEFYKQANDASEKLAALDVVKTIFGPDVAKNLALDDQYLLNIQAKMQEVAATDLTKQADIDRAVALKNQYDAAVAILEQRWHPIQDLLTQAGINMQASWVGIVSSIASAVDWATKLVEKLGAVPNWFQDMANKGATAFMNATTTPESRKASEEYYGITPINPADVAREKAGAALASGLQNPANVLAARNQTVALSDQLRPDKSIAKAPDEADAGAWDRATGSIQKYIQTTNAAAASVDAGAAAQEKLKAIAELTAAGIKDGLTPAAAAAKAQMSGLSDQAAAAAQNLAQAKIASTIKFGANTSLLSAEDVQIATQLKTIYPDVATALGSVEANGMRVNAAFKELSSSAETNLVSGLTDIVSGTKSVGQGFSDMAAAFAKSIEQMIIKIAVVEPLLRALQSQVSGSGLMNFLTPSTGSAAQAASASTLSNNTGGAFFGPGFHSGGIVGSEPTFMRYVHPSYFDNAPKFHSGGIAGDEMPIIAQKGEGIFTKGQMAAMRGGGVPQVNVTLIETPNGGGGTTQKQNANGGIDISVAIAQISAKSAATPGGPMNRVLRDQFGAQQVLARR